MNTITNSNKNERKQARIENIHEYTTFNNKVEKRRRDKYATMYDTFNTDISIGSQNLTINRHLL